MPSNVNRGPRQIWQAFVWSLKGLREGWRIEASFRLEVVLFVILFPLGLWLGHGGLEKFALILVPVRVLSSFTPWDIPIDEESRKGTQITFEEDEAMEQAVFSGIDFNRDES